jgi:ankyrin repeat protein
LDKANKYGETALMVDVRNAKFDVFRFLKELHAYNNPLTPNDLLRRRAASPLKLKSPVTICMKNQQMQHLFIQFINYVW